MGAGVKYRVEVRADAWHRITPGPRSGEWQLVTQVLEDGQRLYVELWRYPWTATLQVAVARIEQAVTTRTGSQQWRTLTILRPEALDLVEVPAPDER